MNTDDILKIFKEKYKNNEFRIIGNAAQQSKTIEIQNANFIADKDWIVREPNYDYFEKELKWYLSQSLNINDIPDGAPKMWKKCADKDGFINSNYGWVIFSDENGDQYKSCRKKLLDDNHTREAIMIYDRPNMQTEYNKNGMHDFMCTQYVQYFINERDGEEFIDCIVNIRSNDAVFGYDNDYLWFDWVLDKLSDDLRFYTGRKINKGIIYWNAGSLHVYERHFKYLE